jgi:hypothetical protein
MFRETAQFLNRRRAEGERIALEFFQHVTCLMVGPRVS